jgi:hypothetical protein
MGRYGAKQGNQEGKEGFEFHNFLILKILGKKGFVLLGL